VKEKMPPAATVISSSSLTSQQFPKMIPTSQVNPSLCPVIGGEKEVIVQEVVVIQGANENQAQQRDED
jgi:hypothetical protein